ncbi:MAG: flagellar protein FlaG [Idiomarinaceae bacterium]|uniref:flagellar protein FlaG n=1 Tax=Idiomarina sp. 28-8 TaxID=1260624 RepID=UPI00031C9D59|nr:flagellar protein FlaG [Idiomarina sp. 28-8]NWO02278.1 flagellar protein FlaG [Idiomarinaceae bacterium]
MGIEIHSGVSFAGIPNDSEQSSSTRFVENADKTANSTTVTSEDSQTTERSKKGISSASQKFQNMIEALNVNDSIRQHNLEFNVNEELGRTIVKVVDSETGELIRQIPSEELLELAERIEEQTQESESSVGYLIDSII